MGCYVYSSGLLKPKADTEKVLKILNEYNYFEDVEVTDDVISVGNYGKYYEEDLKSLLTALKPYIKEGEIVYNGEDDSYWKHKLVGGKWIEYEGFIAYKKVGPVG